MLDSTHTAENIKGLFINGQWQQTSGHFDDLNPSDGQVWARVPNASVTETKQAIDAAQQAFPAWSALKFQERAEYMLKIAAAIERKADQFVNAAQFEGGGWYGKGIMDAGDFGVPARRRRLYVVMSLREKLALPRPLADLIDVVKRDFPINRSWENLFLLGEE